MKILVAHPYHQHEYRLVKALTQAGHEVNLATTVYIKRKSITSFVGNILPRKFSERAVTHRDDNISDNAVIQFCEIGGLIRLFLRNIPKLSRLHKEYFYKLSDKFAKKVAKYVTDNEYDAVITYDNLSPILFEYLRITSPTVIRVMDVSSANIIFMQTIYNDDILLAPNFADRLKSERAICWDEKILHRVSREINATQKFLIPSKFVAKSLLYSGVKEEDLMVCPYGVDISEFKPTDLNRPFNLPLHFVYVGGVKEFKGVAYLFDAFMEIPSDLATLTVIGNYNSTDADILEYMKRINFVGNIIHSKVSAELQKADVFVFASLGEGLSLSALEASASGLPLIVTENSGINDAMHDGIEGFIIPIQSKEAIKEKVLWFVNHTQSIPTMGKAAREMASKYSWQAYGNRIEGLFGSTSIYESNSIG